MRRALALLLLSIAAVVLLAACGSRSDGQVSNDLTQLFIVKGIPFKYGSIDCSHANGNQYSCAYRMPSGGQRFVNVIDDGHAITSTPVL